MGFVMIRIRQIEINALTFNQYDNGVSEIKYHESSERAVDGFFYFFDLVIKETCTDETIYLLSDLTETGHLPLAYHYSRIAQLNSKYDPANRPRVRIANVYKEMSVKRRMVLAYMESLDIPGVALNMFSADERGTAIAWLLSTR